ncbi:MAG: methyltransferase domain-containing protein [Rhodopseudomonas sp.]|nr:methyltransferase domain-containing protein [Rhodopseudomonas sp.]
MSNFDAAAAAFDRHRALPEDAARAVRTAVLHALPPRPRLLDLGAGSGRIGWPFITAGDDYIGLDLSRGMLQAFRARSTTARLVQADGCALPFANETFDGVLLVQIFGGLSQWQALLGEALRVLRPGGALIIGRTRTPDDGVDASMKRQLSVILGEHGEPAESRNSREPTQRQLRDLAATDVEIEAAHWQADRSPRGFIDRHASGARFATLPPTRRCDALRQLSVWATGRFGSLDAHVTEIHRFTLRIFKFAER